VGKDEPQIELPFQTTRGTPHRPEAPSQPGPPATSKALEPGRHTPRTAQPPEAAGTAQSPQAPHKSPEVDEPEVLTVARLDRLIKRLVEGATADVRVRGEVSGLHRAQSGHLYFSLKDEHEDALIDCVMYRTAPLRARKQLRDGEHVVLAGRVTMFAPRGRLQFMADDVLGTSRGALLEALEKLKARLAAEGLFAPERKRPLPRDPRTIAVLTSRDGAAIHDICRVALRRGHVRILLVPTPVQGAGAAERIADAIRWVNRLRDLDVIIVTRGGGSAEDLAPYNDELTVRAIVASRVVVVSAVGHEIDVTLADLAADRRAATPSQAAEICVPDRAERIASLEHLERRLSHAMHHRLSLRRAELARLQQRLGEPRRLLLEQAQRFDDLSARLERAARKLLATRKRGLEATRRRLDAQHPRRVLADARLRLSPLAPKLAVAMRRRLEQLSRKHAANVARLDALSPLSVLSRGYAIATTTEGRVVMDARTVAPGDAIEVRVHHGKLHTRVEDRDPDE
jgi:exodeoxyribonuclease VII large subunit